jgi:hypothetical protein
MLQDIIDELAKGTYSDDDEVAVGELKASSEVYQGAAPAGYVMSYLAQIGKLTTVESISDTVGHTLQNAAKAVMVTVNGRDEFDFTDPAVLAMCDAFVALQLDGVTPSDGSTTGILTSAERDGLLARGQTPKFANVTLKLVRQARGKTNIKSVGNWTASKRKLKITVAGSVFERLQPTITYADNDFTAAPIRRAVEVADESAGTYIVKLDNLRPSGVGTISVELGAPNSFTLDLG